jgi:diacylglycerol O-acyltransferase
MSDTEAIMWAVEKDPALRSDFCNLTILEGMPEEARVLRTLDRAVAAIPRLRQRVVSAPLRIVPPAFADDPTLDLTAHIRRVALPAGDPHRALLDLCASLAEQPLDRARPLWEFTLIEGLPDGRVALLQKVHHTITDGVGGLRLSLAFVDFAPDEPDAPRAEPTAQPAAVTDDAEFEHGTTLQATRTAVVDATARGIGLAKHAVGGTARLVTHPIRIPGRAIDSVRVVHSLRRQLFNRGTARSDVMRGRSLTRHFETHTLALPAVQATARKLGGSINDVYVTGLAAALGRYHARMGSEVRALRLAMPISTRNRNDEAANRFVPARVVIPIQPDDDPRTLFAGVRDRLDAAKNESAIGAAEGLAVVLTPLPTAFLVAMTRAQARTTDFAATNLRGSPIPLYIAGERVIANYPFGPRTNTALNATMLSYGDELNLGLNIDPAAVSDIDGLMRDIALAFDELLGIA